MKKDKNFVEREFQALGTQCYVQIVFENDSDKIRAEKDLMKTEKLFKQKEKIFSRFDENSELNRFNKNLGKYQKASLDMIYLAQKCLKYYNESKGLFDPRMIVNLEIAGYKKDFKTTNFDKLKLKSFSKFNQPLETDLKIRKGKVCFNKRMDFSGIAKGYIIDSASKFLIEKGWKNFLVDSGGDMFAFGQNKKGAVWKMSLEGAKEKILIPISNSGLATSGVTRKNWKINGQKIHHLINPKKPDEFSFELNSVSVVSENSEKADYLAKIIFLKGKTKGINFANKNKIPVIILDKKGNLEFSKKAQEIIIKNQ